MLHKLKNISGSTLNIGTLSLIDNEEIIFFDDIIDNTFGVDDINLSLNDPLNNLNKYLLENDVEYIQDTTIKLNSEFYEFWNEFYNITYPEILNIIEVSRNSINETANGLSYNSTSGLITLDPNIVLMTEEERNNLSQVVNWGDHSTRGYTSTNLGQSGFASVYNNDTSTNLNNSVGVRVPITGIVKDISDDFEVNGEGIKVLNGGRLLCTASIYFTSTVQRASLDIAFEIDSTLQDASFAHGYIRSTSNHNESSITMIQWLDVQDGETIYIKSKQTGLTGNVVMSTNKSIFEIYKPIEEATKGEKGDDGDDGDDGMSAFNFLDGNVVPTSPIGIDGDIYIDTTNNSFYRKSNSTWDYLTTLSSNYNQNQSIVPIWAEESGGLTDNNTQWSFGNGAVGSIGITLPFNSKLIALSLHTETVGTSTTEVVVTINNSNTTYSVSKILGINSSYVDFLNNPLDINSGDFLGFRTITGGSVTDARICAWILMDNREILEGSNSSNNKLSNFISLSSNNSPYLESNNSTYETISKFIYDGNSIISNINSILFVSDGSGTKTGDIRIFDATNSLVIAEATGINSTNTANIVDMGIISNLPTSTSVFEIQLKQIDNTLVRCSGIEIIY